MYIPKSKVKVQKWFSELRASYPPQGFAAFGDFSKFFGIRSPAGRRLFGKYFAAKSTYVPKEPSVDNYGGSTKCMEIQMK